MNEEIENEETSTLNLVCVNCDEELYSTFSAFDHKDIYSECENPVPLVEFDDPYMNMFL